MSVLLNIFILSTNIRKVIIFLVIKLCKSLCSLTIKRYTASCGERRIRVHTLAAPVVSNLSDMYQQADTGAIVSVFSRLGMRSTPSCWNFLFNQFYFVISS